MDIPYKYYNTQQKTEIQDYFKKNGYNFEIDEEEDEDEDW